VSQELNIAVDSGKGYTKSLFKNPLTKEFQTFKFPTKIQKLDSIGFELSKNSYLIEYQGESYLVGEMLNDIINSDLTKQTKEHLLSIYLSIALAIKQSNKKAELCKINLAVNTPLTIFKNKKLKEEFGAFIKQESETIRFVLNNERFYFKIKNLFLVQEGIGSLFVNKDFRDKTVTQIDVGTLNVTVSSYKRLIPQLDSNFSNNMGISSLFSTLRERLSMAYGITIHYNDIEQIIKDKILVVEGERIADSSVIIEEVIQNHANQLLASIKSQVSLNNTEIVLIGGGSYLLKDHLLKLLPYAIFEPKPQFTSLHSFYRIMEGKLHAKVS
jgi:plasmid segregation protein ParM